MTPGTLSRPGPHLVIVRDACPVGLVHDVTVDLAHVDPRYTVESRARQGHRVGTEEAGSKSYEFGART